MDKNRTISVRVFGMLVSLVLVFTLSGLHVQAHRQQTWGGRKFPGGDGPITSLQHVGAGIGNASLSTAPQGPPVSSRVMAGDPDVVSILYRFTDFGNDWQSSNPEWGPIGSIHYCLWEDVNPSPGVYNWSVIDSQLNKERNLKVTLLDGRVIPKPVVLQVLPHISEAPNWPGVYFYDATPQWVYDRIGGSRPVVNGRKVGHRLEDNGAVAVMPMYEDPTWQAAYWEFVRAFGQRYNGNSQVTSIVVTTGLDGETHPIKDTGGHWKAVAEAGVPGLYHNFGNYVLDAMNVYREAFPSKAVFINTAPGDSGLRRSVASHAASLQPPVGLKHSGMWVDMDSHQGEGTYVGSWDMVRTYSTTLPIWLESAYGFGNEELDYWSMLAGLHYHPDAMDLHADYLTTTRPEILRWVSAHLGVTPSDTPSIWTVLRDSEYPHQTWGGGGCSGHRGDWTFWLTRKEVEGGRTVRIMREDMPSEAQGHMYSRQARRTDEANGQEYIYLDVDNQYPFVGQVPATEPEGTVAFKIRVTFINHDGDTLSLEYRNYQGQLVAQTVRKGAALGPVNTWVTHEFDVYDAYLNNNLDGHSDFRLSSNGDGDEIVHMVEVEGRWDGNPPATLTQTPTSTLSPSPTPTLTSTVTPSPTATELMTATPSVTVTGIVPIATVLLTATPSATTTETIPAATPTSTAAVTPDPSLGPGEVRVLADTTIFQSDPATIHGRGTTLAVSGDDTMRALLRFGLGPQPTGMTLVEARLRLHSSARSGVPLVVEAYGLQRTWDEGAATWQHTTQDIPWSRDGADDPAHDRDALATGLAVVQGGERWYEWNVTSLVQRWLDDPASNHGLILIAAGDPGQGYTFSSREGTDAPELVLRYLLPTPTPTVRPTMTPTPTPAATLMPSPSPSPTAVPVPTHTQAPTLMPTETPTLAPTLMPTETPTLAPTASPTEGLMPPLPPAERMELIVGKVVNELHVQGLAGVVVRLYQQQGEGWALLRETQTDDQGTFCWWVEPLDITYRIVEQDPEGYTSVEAMLPPTAHGRVVDANTIELYPSERAWSGCIFVDRQAAAEPAHTAAPTAVVPTEVVPTAIVPTEAPPTNTPTPQPTPTETPQPTPTAQPPTETPQPTPTAPPPTETPQPTPTAQPPTETPQPTPTALPPTETPQPTPTAPPPTATPQPTPTALPPTPTPRIIEPKIPTFIPTMPSAWDESDDGNEDDWNAESWNQGEWGDSDWDRQDRDDGEKRGNDDRDKDDGDDKRVKEDKDKRDKGHGGDKQNKGHDDDKRDKDEQKHQRDDDDDAKRSKEEQKRPDDDDDDDDKDDDKPAGSRRPRPGPRRRSQSDQGGESVANQPDPATLTRVVRIEWSNWATLSTRPLPRGVILARWPI
ncbi:MAG: DNRLRE domain-containing protein [Chloroflexi bacterium]|nr:DNRLRE domain-containing protein [Chloroflexota bacterium]